jgi:glycosyltransferase involved in cell wall biosynthesis
LKKPKIFLVCTGLGIVQRGFESYMADLSNQLQNQNNKFDITLYTGGDYEDGLTISKQLFCVSRNNHFWNSLLGKVNTAEFELISFFSSLLLEVITKKPKAIYLGEYKLYCYLFKIRKFLKLDYSLVLYTGGQVSPGLFDTRKDFIHHVTDIYYDDLVSAGFPKERQFVLPHFISLKKEINSIDNKLIRSKAKDKKIIISVGVIDSTIKRMDQFVKVLSDEADNYFPIILGEFTDETDKIIEDLNTYFGKDNYFVGKVSKEALYAYLKQADLFMMLSPKESFGLASLEALSVGLPVICCEFHESRFVLKNNAFLIDCNDIYHIRATLSRALHNSTTDLDKLHRIKFVKENYSWESLSTKYINMFNCFVQNNLN